MQLKRKLPEQNHPVDVLNCDEEKRPVIKMTTETFRFNLNATEKLNFKAIPTWVTDAAQVLMDNHKAAYLVGGAVRDLLWGSQPSDWDLATDALPDEIEKIFPQTFPTGKRFGTITVAFEGHQLEISTLREELGYSDGRRPEQVVFGVDILKDLARRDFTINAIAYDFKNRVLIDPYNGRTDCWRRIIRAVGDPRIRFREDGLRMFRLYRFIATHDLKPERQTQRAVNPEWAQSLSFERIRDEFSKLLLAKSVRKGLTGLIESGLMATMIPEFFTTAEPYPGLNIALQEHSFSAVATIKPLLHLRLAALLHDIAKPSSLTITRTGLHFYGHDQKGADVSRAILTRLRYPRKLIEKVTLLIRWHMFFYQPNISDAAVRKIISKVGPENIFDLLELRRADMVATGKITTLTHEYWKDLSERVRCILENITTTGEKNILAVNGHDLIGQLGLNPGPLIGEIMAYLLEQVYNDPNLNQKDILLDLAHNYINPNPL